MSALLPVPADTSMNTPERTYSRDGSTPERTYSRDDSTVEYTYYTEPEWAADAVLCTETGLELNFEKLNTICDSGVLPSKISITLHSSPIKQTNNNHTNKVLDVIVSDDTVVSAHLTTPRRTSKLDNSRTEIWQRSTTGSQHADESRSGKRKESIIEQEIRLQKQREEDVLAERQRVLKHQTSHKGSPVIPTQPISNSAASEQNVTLTSQSPIRLNGNSPASTGSIKTTMSSTRTTEEPDANKTISSDKRSSWYVKESPIQRDIRINKEREAELKSRRNAAAN